MTDKELPILSWDTSDYSTEEEMNSELEYLKDELTEVMSRINPSNRWHCEVRGFGWLSQDGYKEFTADNGEDLLDAVLPKTDNTFQIYQDGEHGLKIQNWHHDNPVRGEFYYLTPGKES